MAKHVMYALHSDLAGGLHGNMFNCASLTSDNAAAATLDEVGKSLQKEIEVIQECINKNLTEHPGVILGDPGGLPQAYPRAKRAGGLHPKAALLGPLPKPDH